MSSSGSSSTGEGEEDWSDWIEEAQPVRSLWDDTLLPTATEAVQHDARIHGFDIVEHSARLGLDYYGYMRLVNYIRAEKPSPAEAKALSRDAPLFTEDAYLKPALEDDALLRAQRTYYNLR
jgi:protein arginine N-methyltransferase 3